MKKAIILSILLCCSVEAANEIRAFEAASSTCYAVVREIDGDVWYPTGQVFEAFGTGGRVMDNYDIALVNKIGGMQVGSMDTNIGAGQYYVVSHMQAGGSPADTDPAIFQEYGYWTGSTWTPATITSIDIADAVWSANVASYTTETTFGGEVGGLDPNLTFVLADTAELQTDWTNGGRLDLILDAIRAITDILPALSTTVATPNDMNNFILTAGVAVADAYNGMTLYIRDADDSHWESRLIIDWAANRTIDVDEPFGFVPAAADLAYIWGQPYFPMDIWDALPIPLPKPETTVVNLRIPATGGGAGGTKTLDYSNLDP
uniref:Uncharacterized protein n=1 Tax=viral metagenome TaxID=1070528 RepID=A0A6M3JFF7_9ZZZZ